MNVRQLDRVVSGGCLAFLLVAEIQYLATSRHPHANVVSEIWMGVLELTLLGGIFFHKKWAFWVAGLYWGVGLVVIALSYLADANARIVATVNPLNAFQVLIAPVYCWWRLATWRRHEGLKINGR